MIYAILLAVLAFAAPQDHTIDRGETSTAVFSSGSIVSQVTPTPTSSDQTIQTSIQDPAEPEEPWTVTTHRRSGESMSAFLKRHREVVQAVRAELRGNGG